MKTTTKKTVWKCGAFSKMHRDRIGCKGVGYATRIIPGHFSSTMTVGICTVCAAWEREQATAHVSYGFVTRDEIFGAAIAGTWYPGWLLDTVAERFETFEAHYRNRFAAL